MNEHEVKRAILVVQAAMTAFAKQVIVEICASEVGRVLPGWSRSSTSPSMCWCRSTRCSLRRCAALPTTLLRATPLRASSQEKSILLKRYKLKDAQLPGSSSTTPWRDMAKPWPGGQIVRPSETAGDTSPTVWSSSGGAPRHDHRCLQVCVVESCSLGADAGAGRRIYPRVRPRFVQAPSWLVSRHATGRPCELARAGAACACVLLSHGTSTASPAAEARRSSRRLMRCRYRSYAQAVAEMHSLAHGCGALNDATAFRLSATATARPA